jgi:hypothetical protein
MAKFEGRGKCACCEQRGRITLVDVYSDKNGLAYYNCGPCRVRVVHRDRRASAECLANIDRHAVPDDSPPVPPVRPAPGPAPAPAAPPAPAPEPPKPEEKPKAAPKGFLSQFSL